MAVIQDLLKRVADAELRARLEEEISRLTKHKKFGLVFEEHLPECTPLYDVKIKRGMTVATKQADCGALFVVKSIKDGVAECVPVGEGDAASFNVDELVAVARFGDPIYPCLKKLDSIDNGGGDLWHTLIQADNYHALQLLEYLYPGKVDCIYIDPPYNTGAKDWKYNNDYVDSSDSWRHSKWLSMMEKRLALAKKLLNPKDSVLIVTIDEKEYLHLGMLLEQMFPEARMQMVSTVINPKGSVKDGQFTRCEEYIYYLAFGEAMIQGDRTDYLFESEKKDVRWPSLKRTGTHSSRQDRPNLFYPLFYDASTKLFVKVGKILPINMDRHAVNVPDGLVAVWPLDEKGEERVWQLGPETLMEIAGKGFVKFGLLKNETASPYYLSSGLRDQIDSGEIVIASYGKDGVAQLEYADGTKAVLPKTIWNVTTHSASEHGTKLITQIIGDKKFSFPKSLYAVKDSIRCVVARKPNALILDFFAGSGTTLHAVNLLNAEDGGNRRCILVTNNEVSVDEAKDFAKHGIKPGEDEWEQKGIAQYVTWPRTTCSIKGVDVKGAPLKGDYLGGDKEHPRHMADGFKSNAAFFKLGFVDPSAVSIGRAFKEILPLLWLKAGAHGPCPKAVCPEDMLVCPENRFAVLMDECCFASFANEVKQHPEIETLYFVTDYERSYKAMAARFPGKAPYQLYTDYLENFRVNRERK